MADPQKTLSGRFGAGFNLLIPILLITALLANYWLIVNGVRTGTIYFYMLIGSGVLIGLLFLFFRNSETFDGLINAVRVPFGTSLTTASVFFLLGIAAPFLFTFGLRIIGSQFSITSFSVPLFSSNILQGVTQSFSAAEVSASMPWKIFNLVFNAGVTEEWVFTFGMMIVGAIIAKFILTIFGSKLSFIKSEKNFVIIFAMLFATATFAGAHLLNATYIGSMFLIAAAFKLITIVLIYYFGFLLTFTIGYHMANNFIYLYQQEGIAVLHGLWSWVGLLMFGIIALLIIHLYIKRNTLWSDLKDSF
ncbi:MAG: hypothetical protein [Siphoviridae sp. ctjeG17]|nr:MAG: hypothetical protein [Siphoviridae sp. ctjeG17]